MFNNYFDEEIINADKYIDFFGYGKEAGIANVDINNMLEEIERLYDKDSMPWIKQIMVHSDTCGHCKKSIPFWEKITESLTARLRHYTHDLIEFNESIVVEGATLTGHDLAITFKVKGLPFFLQNFKAKVILQKKPYRREVRRLKLVPFHVVSVGEIQPFHFLATTFNLNNLNMVRRVNTFN